MIRIRPRPNSTNGMTRLYENLVPVGQPRGNDNTNTDLASNQLVQVFLRLFFTKRPQLAPKTAGGSTRFLIDGKVGIQTINGISIFQEFIKKGGTPLIKDSRVSVPIGDFVPGTAIFWTIHALNAQCFIDFGAVAFNGLSLNPVLATTAPQLALELLQEEQLLVS